MAGQLGQLLLAVGSRPVDNPGDNDNANYDPSAANDNDNKDDNAYNKYHRDEYETVASLPPNNPRSYDKSAIVLSRGETFPLKSKSGLYFCVTVISTTFQ